MKLQKQKQSRSPDRQSQQKYHASLVKQFKYLHKCSIFFYTLELEHIYNLLKQGNVKQKKDRSSKKLHFKILLCSFNLLFKMKTWKTRMYCIKITLISKLEST